jgi:hypothetical protein
MIEDKHDQKETLEHNFTHRSGTGFNNFANSLKAQSCYIVLSLVHNY